jgi:hypothetical protein
MRLERQSDGDSAPKLVGNNVLYSSRDQALWIAEPLSCAADAVGSASSQQYVCQENERHERRLLFWISLHGCGICNHYVAATISQTQRPGVATGFLLLSLAAVGLIRRTVRRRPRQQ